MKTLDISDIARDLESAAKYYLVDACADRLSGKLREWFDEALNQRRLQDVIEIVAPAAVFLTASIDGDGKMTTTVGSTPYKVTRFCTAKFVGDVDNIRVNTGKFISDVRLAVVEYARTLPADIKVATVPALYMCAKAYVVEWFLWGYAGTLNDEALRR